MIREPLDSRIEAVFYPRESNNDHAWASLTPEEAFVIAHEEHKAMFIEEKETRHDKKKHKHKDNNEKKGHYEHRNYSKLFKIPFNLN
jgi:hypothetical protein